MERIASAIHEVVAFARNVPGFEQLNQADQICLLKNGSFEVKRSKFAFFNRLKQQR